MARGFRDPAFVGQGRFVTGEELGGYATGDEIREGILRDGGDEGGNRGP